jgi:nicotinate-nucleotide adenylyltransferase
VSRRIGVVGGTFDPPHIGHLAMAVEAQAQADLDEVQFVVAGDPWQKTAIGAVTVSALRMEMTQAAINGHAGFVVSDIEANRVGPSYMVDTLAALSAAGTTLVLILGADAAELITTWHQWPRLGDLCEIVVVDRADRLVSSPVAQWHWTNIDMARLDVSSSDLRGRARAGRPLDVLCPSSVIEIIEREGLYYCDVTTPARAVGAAVAGGL